jgi:hypothetical protein
LFSSSSEIRPSPLERRQAVIEEKIQQTIKSHFLDGLWTDWGNLGDHQGKAGIIIKLGGQIFVQYRQVTLEELIPFRDEISNQMTEFVKKELEILPPDAKLSVETYFLRKVFGANTVVILNAQADTHTPHVHTSGGKTHDTLGRWIIERMKDCPPDFKQFFLVP